MSFCGDEPAGAAAYKLKMVLLGSIGQPPILNSVLREVSQPFYSHVLTRRWSWDAAAWEVKQEKLWPVIRNILSTT
jgi:hypothetical protein